MNFLKIFLPDTALPVISGTSSQQSAGDPLSSAILDINQEFKEREVQQHARDLGISYVDVSIVPINDDLLRLISLEESQGGEIIAFFRVGKKVRVGLLDPEKRRTKEVLERMQKEGFTVNINLCSPESLKIAQKNYSRLKVHDESVKNMEQEQVRNISNIKDEILSIADLPKKFEEIRSDLALAFLHREAIALNASDLHFEHQKDGVRVRARINGLLSDFFTLSNKIAVGILRQIKFNANIKSNAPGLPADGEYTFFAGDREVMVRVSILPLHNGEESIVMRFLDPDRQNKKLSDLGFSDRERREVEKLLQAREGLILVTGPTGSGKTTTLYATLRKINTPEKKIITLEDPVEYRIRGMVQSSINEEKGYNFAAGVRSVLRQDPDVLLVGEIRDRETAEAALQASITGHLVLSTVHTNSAIETIARLKNLGVPPYLLGAALKGIVSQRLVRQVCPHCSVEGDFTEPQKTILMNIIRPLMAMGTPLPNFSGKARVPQGCDACGKSGFSGRIVVSETISVSPALSLLIAKGEGEEELTAQVRLENFQTIAIDTAIKVLTGQTTFDEAVRVLGSRFV
ncbi:MAG: GspE/PulE family protein [Candidatus Peregrinibacteria bacterium]